MERAIRGYEKIRGGICRGMEIFSYCSLVAILAMVVIEVVFRSLFAISNEYFVELPHLIIAYIPFLYAATAFKENKHIHVSLIPRGLSPRTNRFVTLGIDIVVAYACYLLIRTALALIEIHVATDVQTYTGIPISLWIFSISCPVGLGMLFLLSVERVIRNFWGQGETPAKELENEIP